MPHSVYDIITSKIVEALESGVVPWQKPWTTAMPCNLISQKDYRGINVWLTGMQGFPSKYWLTFNQCAKLGGRIVKGSKSTPITYWNVGDEKLNPKTGKLSKPFLLRYFSVFNLCQTEGIELPRALWDANKRSEFEVVSVADALIAGMPNPPAYQASDAAWYRPSVDTVGMPHRSSFTSPASFYATLFHELAHATGAKQRLHREAFDNLAIFGSESYSSEELVAELTSSYLCGLSGIERETVPNSAAYLKTWIARLKGDSRLIVAAASAAQKAADYISRNTIASKSDETLREIDAERIAA
jgi:antirestriction protein ArdC